MLLFSLTPTPVPLRACVCVSLWPCAKKFLFPVMWAVPVRENLRCLLRAPTPPLRSNMDARAQNAQAQQYSFAETHVVHSLAHMLNPMLACSSHAHSRCSACMRLCLPHHPSPNRDCAHCMPCPQLLRRAPGRGCRRDHHGPEAAAGASGRVADAANWSVVDVPAASGVSAAAGRGAASAATCFSWGTLPRAYRRGIVQ